MHCVYTDETKYQQGVVMSQSRSSRSIGAIILIAIGFFFLVTQTLGISIWGIFGFSWPLFIVIPGLIFLGLAILGDKRTAGFIVPGAIVTGTGAILWMQNATDRWESWAYIWTLYPVFLGFALMFLGRRTDSPNTEKSGRGFVTWGTVAFLVGFTFFELIIFGGLSGLGSVLVPLILIGIGVMMLFGGRVPSLSGDKFKRKNDLPLYTGPRVINGSRSNGSAASVSDDLQRRIDEAIAEDDPDAPKTSV
jgi:hypothetical protein